MAFKTNRLGAVFQQIVNEAADVKAKAAQLRTQSAAGPVNSDAILKWFAGLASTRTTLVALAATPGLSAYAQNEVNDGTYNVVTEFNAMRDAIDAALAWVVSNFPKETTTNRWLDSHEIVSNVLTPRSFSTASLATFRTVLSSLEATIS